MIAIIDYGVGNLYSLKSSLDLLGIDAIVSRRESDIKKCKKIILPGVGAFADAAKSLAKYGLDELLIGEAKNGKPILGICLGMQLLFDKSFEYGEHCGLGLISGSVRPIADVVSTDFKTPHIGWNSLHFPGNKTKSPLFRYVNEGEFVYFVHSYYCADCDENVTAVAEYGAPLTAAAENGNVFGCQFHPEKSGEVGMKILKAFNEFDASGKEKML